MMWTKYEENFNVVWMTLSLLKRREANLVLTCLRSNIREKKDIRRLQTLSISHCLLRRLRKCFDCFKLLLDPTFKMSAQEWYRKYLVSSVFGRWVKFVHDQQRDEGKLLDRSISFYKRKSIKDIPPMTPESDAMSKDLKKRCFRFVGPTICYAFMQAVGIVNDHTKDCFRCKK